MELPAALRHAVDRALEGISLAELTHAAGTLSARYRGEVRDGHLHLSDEQRVLAYLATRLPATYAAIRTSLEETALADPTFAPRRQLDIGAGPGSALWAASECWPELDEALLVEASPVMRSWGEKLSLHNTTVRSEWRQGDRLEDLASLKPYDLVSMAYVLNELPPAMQGPLIERLWALTAGVLVIVEPGTPAGWSRLMEARARLLAAGAHLLAPCPHAEACPLLAPDWCHFSRKVARSRIHRQAKGADVPWEDEKFCYLAAARHPGQPPAARLIAPPRAGSGRVNLTLCEANGTRCERLFTRRDGALFKAARRLDWGEGLKTPS